MVDSFDISRRQLLAGIVTVGLTSAGAGAGTMAAFSDTESSTGNTVQAGTLDLTLDGSSQTVTFLDETGIVPDDDGSGSVKLRNEGTIPGVLEIEVTRIDSTENGYYGKENSNQDTSPNDGELDEYLEIRASLGGTEILGWTTANAISEGQTFTASSSIAGGGSTSFTVEWRLPTDASDLAQSDGFSFDLTFRLIQEGSA